MGPKDGESWRLKKPPWLEAEGAMKIREEDGNAKWPTENMDSIVQ